MNFSSEDWLIDWLICYFMYIGKKACEYTHKRRMNKKKIVENEKKKRKPNQDIFMWMLNLWVNKETSEMTERKINERTFLCSFEMFYFLFLFIRFWSFFFHFGQFVRRIFVFGQFYARKHNFNWDKKRVDLLAVASVDALKSQRIH